MVNDCQTEAWLVPIDDLLDYWDPFVSWNVGPIDPEDVRQAIRTAQYQYNFYNPEDFKGNEDNILAKTFHTQRIAWLVVNRDINPILIDIGIPALGHYPRNFGFDFIDGNHRFCAAVIRGDEVIPVTFDGDSSLFPELFPCAIKIDRSLIAVFDKYPVF